MEHDDRVHSDTQVRWVMIYLGAREKHNGSKYGCRIEEKLPMLQFEINLTFGCQ